MLGTKINKLSRRTMVLILVAAAVVVAAAFLYKSYSDRSAKPAETVQEPGSKINLDPPTEQELAESAANKEKITNEAQSENTGADTNQYGKTKVTPIITSVNQNELRGFISGIAEDGGTCTATFTQGSASFTKQSSGFRNVDSTNCSVIKLDRLDFTSSGEWSVTLEYSSNNATGASEQSKFGVN